MQFVLFRGKSLLALRERVERQRSVNSCSPAADSNSLEGLNLERGRPFQEETLHNRSFERLDNQVTSLHEDVTTLSIEVSQQKNI